MPTHPPISWTVQLTSGDAVRVIVRAGAINLLVNDEAPSFSFDLVGRLHGAFVEGVNYRRSLDNRVLAKWANLTATGRERRRRWLEDGEAATLVGRAYALARQAATVAGTAPPPVRHALEQLVRWDWPALQEDRQRFFAVYSPIGILPPDQYLALVLQATHGCSHNACTFCTFYQDIPFRIKTPDQFRQHVVSVLDFFGPALAMRKSIFLGDANALVIPMPQLLVLLEVLSEWQSVRVSGAGDHRSEAMRVSAEKAGINAPLHRAPLLVPSVADQPRLSAPLTSDPLTSDLLALPLFAFIDAFHVERKSVADWQKLAARGLRRVYIGMESGHNPLLRWLNKPGDAEDVLEAVVKLKAAGVHVSVIILLGAGGDRYADGHVADTVRLLNAMPLGRGDIIYFSDFVDQPGAPYAALASVAGVRGLDATAMRRQETAIRSAFAPRDPRHPPQFSRYNVDEFIY